MEITRNVILDLLPLYLAGEVSGETRALVEEFLEGDPEMVKIVEQSAALESAADVPAPLTKNGELKAYGEARRRMVVRILLLAVLLAFILVACAVITGIAIFFVSPA
jgi:predicted anti-sigma-YlaC factor YlaD